MLAWLRTAFGAYAVAIVIGGVLPQLADSGSVVYRLVGGAFALIGVLDVALGLGQYVSTTESGRAPAACRGHGQARSRHAAPGIGTLEVE